MSNTDNAPLHPDPDIATATVISHLTERPPPPEPILPPQWFGEQLKTQPQPQPEPVPDRALANYSRRMHDAGYTEDCNYMLKGLYRRACLQEAAYIHILNQISQTYDAAAVRRLTLIASEFNNQLNETLSIIYRIKSDQRDGLDPLLVAKDFAIIDDPRPTNAIGMLGNTRAVAVEIDVKNV